MTDSKIEKIDWGNVDLSSIGIILKERKRREPLFRNTTWTYHQGSEHLPPQAICSFICHGHTGFASFFEVPIDQAQEILALNQRLLSEAFDELTLNPPSTPQVQGSDFRFDYDSYSATPKYKYTAVNGTLTDKTGQKISFAMSKRY